MSQHGSSRISLPGVPSMQPPILILLVFLHWWVGPVFGSEEAVNLCFSSSLFVILRNLLFAGLLYGFAYLIFDCPAIPLFHAHRHMGRRFTPTPLLRREIRRTLLAVVIGSLWECVLLRFVAIPTPFTVAHPTSGRSLSSALSSLVGLETSPIGAAAAVGSDLKPLDIFPNAMAVCLALLIQVPVLVFFADLHFYAVHRLLHTNQVVAGAIPGLYSAVHAVHHESYNPSAWSGLSFHPLESFLYFSVTSITAFFPLLSKWSVATAAHVASALAVAPDALTAAGGGDGWTTDLVSMVRGESARVAAAAAAHPALWWGPAAATLVTVMALYSPIFGHVGVGDPAGAYHHFLHHRLRSTNYGGTATTDYLMGTLTHSPADFEAAAAAKRRLTTTSTGEDASTGSRRVRRADVSAPANIPARA
eukprot:TRINITY_DN33128_c0_g1_i1.p1 TRINITY_DN33128_c0_g1~~TRINITY_DN33128_c0_g1_i1.p1  ORF type:complete len:419 (-),score=46.24 TRINITY_DN33128_c0_g1_i1:342-1598(-)